MAAASPKASEIVSIARGWLGTPYRHQASLRGAGCDCIGLIRGVWREIGGREPKRLPAYSKDWAETGGEEALLNGLAAQFAHVPSDARKAGMVAVFRWRQSCAAKHAALLTGPDGMIHVHEGICVSEVAFCTWWQRRLAGVFIMG
ncbi:NlpC/P60 family putative phage cell wall peptidase [Rhodoligotrophos appendicifer]|uniref:NlpC/P60 family protein n=1 Tax=Rhodoligotrophos appendicifer TaxID=987056 RepID=UPI0011870C0A|nr:NlpC/P60 family protein [Rhodoligotrophos appendicifer]